MARKVVMVSDRASQYECVRDGEKYLVYEVWNDGKKHRRRIGSAMNLHDAISIIQRGVHEDLIEDMPYTREELGDYSPSAPWGAPGMRVSDFL